MSSKSLSQPLSVTLDKNFVKSNINKIPLDLSPIRKSNKLAFLLENVFTTEECKKLIEISESAGYVRAAVNMGSYEAIIPGYRDGERCIIDDKEFVQILQERIIDYLPEYFQDCKLVEINERLRFLSYLPGDKFQCHTDGSYMREDGSAETLITLQIYLNEDFEGGETTFMRCSPEIIRVPVIPKTGTILVFEHNILHEGSIVKEGKKYTIRTDVLYTM